MTVCTSLTCSGVASLASRLWMVDRSNTGTLGAMALKRAPFWILTLSVCCSNRISCRMNQATSVTIRWPGASGKLTTFPCKYKLNIKQLDNNSKHDKEAGHNYILFIMKLTCILLDVLHPRHQTFCGTFLISLRNILYSLYFHFIPMCEGLAMNVKCQFTMQSILYSMLCKSPQLNNSQFR